MFLAASFKILTDPQAQFRRQFITLVKKRIQPGSGSSLDFLTQRTWVHPVTDLNTLIQQAPFVVVGGIATRLYMPERLTLDLDILIHSRDAVLVYQDLERHGSQCLGELGIPGSRWRLTDGTDLDVLESSEAWAEAALSSPESAPDGLPVIALPYLVLMKLQASRTQDLADVSRMLGNRPPSELEPVRRTIATYLPTACEDLESLISLGNLEYNA